MSRVRTNGAELRLQLSELGLWRYQPCPRIGGLTSCRSAFVQFTRVTARQETNHTKFGVLERRALAQWGERESQSRFFTDQGAWKRRPEYDCQNAGVAPTQRRMS